jgi:hypothetical protein
MVSIRWKVGTVTQTSGESDPSYPTEWHMIDDINKIECRQLSDDTYQLKSLSHILTINKEGFNLFRDHSPQGAVIWNDWLKRNNIISEPIVKVAQDDE